ncbi:endonuclease/exonuclease/phosphatase family protein [Shewanella atlantica]|uniref:Endonuclease/exonuclease/phosphatase family protein n=1 Tax=Shewanella atlantica TaxID=271099 RepID=A0A3S0IXA1_9GAMM|nr:endonuclease/exonuclease/phosphatase family protein [Shewanella atlantica]RTR33415.1 endonuclease/exonuclease/phosphatase family protein [Shewanella atlantica]
MKFVSKQRRLLAIVCFIAISFVLTFSGVNHANGTPKVMINLVEPIFQTQCAHPTASGYLDLDGRLNVSVWNIYKQKRKNWKPVLKRLSHSSQLVLLQEAGLTTEMVDFINSHSLNVAMAKAFKLFGTSLGVMNLSDSGASSACAFHATEPLIRFAKSALVTHYPLSNGETLLVVNLHGINFDWKLTRYTEQFEALSLELGGHSGPIILAGDFNTWRNDRLKLISEFAKRFGLSEAEYHLDERQRFFGLALDHLFYRGLDFHHAESKVTDASDHNPIIAHFTLKS